MFRPTLIMLIIFYSTGTYQRSTPESTFYIAAVVEYSPVSEIGSDGMRGLVTQNVHKYIHFIEDAARQDADMIVFPEVGLTSYGKSMYASPIPDPQDHANPCTNNSSGMSEEIALLSCAAKTNDIYVVINFPEMKICNEIVPGSDCVHNGTFYYNSDIVFDRRGYVVARYRKYNLFLEHEFNKTPEPEISVFETDFGVRFGMFTCFDVLFKAPALTLVQQFNVTDVAVPQAWFSELPFLTALQSQSQWSYAMDVNLLAAGYSKPSVGSTGSGIYSGRNGPLVATFSSVNTSKLLVATVPKKVAMDKDNPVHANFDGNNLLPQHESPREHLHNYNRDSVQPVCDDNSISSQPSSVGECVSSESVQELKLMKENLSAYTTLSLDVSKPSDEHAKNVSVHLCSNNLCCNFTVKTLGLSRDELSSESSHYRLVVYSGMRSFAGAADGGIQVCGIVSCDSEFLSTCGSPPSRANVVRPTFSHILITGNFNASNAVQMPNAMAVNYKIINPKSYLYTSTVINREKVNVTLQLKESVSNLLTFGIFGRYFDDDVFH